jgi:hypothetical protein
MAELCPYCHQAELPARSRETLWTDLTARALSIARIYCELAKARDFTIRQFGRAMLDADSLPVATREDRVCPYCYKGNVTHKAKESVWLDLAAKGMGVIRVYFEAKRGEQVPWIAMARAIVEGSNPEIYARKSRTKVTATVEPFGDEDFDEGVGRRETSPEPDASFLEDDPRILDVSTEDEPDNDDPAPDVEEVADDDDDDDDDDDEDYSDKEPGL